MKITEFIQALSDELPLTLAMPDDPVGTQVLVEDRVVTCVAVAYEIDEVVVAEAEGVGAEMIVAFHPLIYPSLQRITGATRVERSLVSLIDRRIALHIVHTAFDRHPQGTSALLAERLGLQNIRPMIPDSGDPSAGMGALGELSKPMELSAFAEQLRQSCNVAGVRISSNPHRESVGLLRRIGIVGGSGMSFYEEAVRAGADAFVTADVRYHAFHAANDRIPILDPGHAESEFLVADGIASLVTKVVQQLGESIRVITLTAPTNPVRLIV